jgi:tetratricopeptide (TPR) repeat protein
MTSWIAYCEPPRPRPADKDWDVFLSYRSLDRLWTIALHDTLRQCGYQVFLDQFALVAGQGLTTQLGTNLEKSASGVLIWSTRTSDSTWVATEIDAMKAMQNNSQNSDFPFYYVVASLDGQKPPGLLGGMLYLDFSAYPQGPTGVELVKLIAGLQGKPPRPEAVQMASQYDTALKREPADLRALAEAGLHEDIVAKVTSDDPAYTTTAQLPALAVELLIRSKRYGPGELGQAGEALNAALARFPDSVRLRQLRGLLLRRAGQPERAQYELTKLLGESQRDTETLGMLAAVWADLWAKREAEGDDTGARDALEESRALYAEGFTKVPTDTYTGINAAFKSALLGDLDRAKTLASQVLERLQEQAKQRGGAPSTDYWERVTEPEALLLSGDADGALKLYHEARIAHQSEKGSIASTALQLQRLLRVLPLAESAKAALAKEFRLNPEAVG